MLHIIEIFNQALYQHDAIDRSWEINRSKLQDGRLAVAGVGARGGEQQSGPTDCLPVPAATECEWGSAATTTSTCTRAAHQDAVATNSSRFCRAPAHSEHSCRPSCPIPEYPTDRHKPRCVRNDDSQLDDDEHRGTRPCAVDDAYDDSSSSPDFAHGWRRSFSSHLCSPSVEHATNSLASASANRCSACILTPPRRSRRCVVVARQCSCRSAVPIQVHAHLSQQ